jgi:7,8-dihydroneopterin aldolase/epimerase/oxygenase
MVSVEIRNLILHAYHGVYEDEHKTGSAYEVNLEVKFDDEGSEFESLEDTINYEDLLSIVKQRMMVRNSLLEKVADGIIRKIKHQCPRAREIRLSIYKLQPPVENFQGKLGVTMHKRFDD